MSNKGNTIKGNIAAGGYALARKAIRCLAPLLVLCSLWFAMPAKAQSVTPFDAGKLVNQGDNVKYGSYIVYKIGDGIYQINDPE